MEVSLRQNGTIGARSRPLVPAIARAAAVMDALMANGGEAMSLSSLARQLRVPKSSMANVCVQLVEEGLLARVHDQYRLGPKLATLGAVYLASVDIVREFQSACAGRDPRLATTAKLASLGEHGEIVYLARHDVSRPSALSLDISVQQPAHCTASGKAMLAALPDESLKRWLTNSSPLVRRTANTITDLSELRKAVIAARSRGITVDDEECIEGVVCVGTAIYSERDTHDAFGISLAILKQHADTRRLRALSTEVRRLSNDLIKLLGHDYRLLGSQGAS